MLKLGDISKEKRKWSGIFLEKAFWKNFLDKVISMLENRGGKRKNPNTFLILKILLVHYTSLCSLVVRGCFCNPLVKGSSPAQWTHFLFIIDSFFHFLLKILDAGVQISAKTAFFRRDLTHTWHMPKNFPINSDYDEYSECWRKLAQVTLIGKNCIHFWTLCSARLEKIKFSLKSPDGF